MFDPGDVIIRFQITVAHSDYKSIMKILNQNLQEGQKAEPATGVPKINSKGAVKGQNSGKLQSVKSTVAEVAPVETKKPRTSIKFSFTMDSFVIDLLNTVSAVSRSIVF